MKNVTLEKNCNCPLDCNSISYSFSLVSSPLIEEEHCAKTPSDLLTEFYEKPFPKGFIRNVRKFTKNVSADPTEICKKYLKYRAVVIFKLATNDVAVTVTSRRLSFFDKISGFGEKFCLTIYRESELDIEFTLFLLIAGGILGLFTGMSILSMIEIAFWIVRLLVSSIRASNRNK